MTLHIGQIRARGTKIWTLDPNFEELEAKLKTKTVHKFQAWYCLSREHFVYNIHAPFLVQAQKENLMSFLLCKIDHKFPISGFCSLRLKWEIHTDARKHMKHYILLTTHFCWLKLAQLISDYRSRYEKASLLKRQCFTPYECLDLSLLIGVYLVHFEQQSTEK